MNNWDVPFSQGRKNIVGLLIQLMEVRKASKETQNSRLQEQSIFGRGEFGGGLAWPLQAVVPPCRNCWTSAGRGGQHVVNVYGKHGVWCGAVKGWLRAEVQLVLALLGFLKIVLIFQILFSVLSAYTGGVVRWQQGTWHVLCVVGLCHTEWVGRLCGKYYFSGFFTIRIWLHSSPSILTCHDLINKSANRTGLIESDSIDIDSKFHPI